MLDDQRPTLTLTSPKAGANPPVGRLLVGIYDYGGLDEKSLTVVADFPVNGVPAGQNLASRFRPAGQGTWELPLSSPLRMAKLAGRSAYGSSLSRAARHRSCWQRSSRSAITPG